MSRGVLRPPLGVPWPSHARHLQRGLRVALRGVSPDSEWSAWLLDNASSRLLSESNWQTVEEATDFQDRSLLTDSDREIVVETSGRQAARRHIGTTTRLPLCNLVEVLREFDQEYGLCWHGGKEVWMGYSPGRSENCEIVLPRVLDQPTSNSMSCRKFTDQLEQEGIGCQLVVLLSAESAALGLWEDGSLKEHKVLRGYTVRKQQGKAQATYERRGGGAGSAGGSLRSRETRRLFQSVASRLAEWGPRVAACNRLFASGGVRSWNELYASRSPAPGVDRRDARWRRVGVAVRRPKFADLDRVYRVLSEGTLCTYRDADFGAQTPGHVSDAGS